MGKMGTNEDDFRQRIRQKLKKNREDFELQYQDVLNDLRGLPKEEIDKLTPNVTDQKTYDNLVSVVEEATRVNLSQAQLKKRIQELGSGAVNIAKKIAGLAKLFV